MRFKVQKHIMFHILYIVAPLCFTFLKRADFYKADHSEKRGVLWLASYPVRCDWPNTSSVWRKCYAPYRIVMPCLGLGTTTQKKKPIINKVFVASSEYNDKQQALLYTAQTRVWLVSSRIVFTGCDSEASDCPCKVGIAPLYRNSLCASQHCRLTFLFQVQEIVPCKMRCTHSNIWVELFWNSVVNTT